VANIPGSWPVQLKGREHRLMFQYPEKFTAVLDTFFDLLTYLKNY
jgi:hypothetical protein